MILQHIFLISTLIHSATAVSAYSFKFIGFLGREGNVISTGMVRTGSGAVEIQANIESTFPGLLEAFAGVQEAGEPTQPDAACGDSTNPCRVVINPSKRTLVTYKLRTSESNPPIPMFEVNVFDNSIEIPQNECSNKNEPQLKFCVCGDGVAEAEMEKQCKNAVPIECENVDSNEGLGTPIRFWNTNRDNANSQGGGNSGKYFRFLYGPRPRNGRQVTVSYLGNTQTPTQSHDKELLFNFVPSASVIVFNDAECKEDAEGRFGCQCRAAAGQSAAFEFTKLLSKWGYVWGKVRVNLLRKRFRFEAESFHRTFTVKPTFRIRFADKIKDCEYFNADCTLEVDSIDGDQTLIVEVWVTNTKTQVKSSETIGRADIRNGKLLRNPTDCQTSNSDPGSCLCPIGVELEKKGDCNYARMKPRTCADLSKGTPLGQFETGSLELTFPKNYERPTERQWSYMKAKSGWGRPGGSIFSVRIEDLPNAQTSDGKYFKQWIDLGPLEGQEILNPDAGGELDTKYETNIPAEAKILYHLYATCMINSRNKGFVHCGCCKPDSSDSICKKFPDESAPEPQPSPGPDDAVEELLTTSTSTQSTATSSSTETTESKAVSTTGLSSTTTQEPTSSATESTTKMTETTSLPTTTPTTTDTDPTTDTTTQSTAEATSLTTSESSSSSSASTTTIQISSTSTSVPTTSESTTEPTSTHSTTESSTTTTAASTTSDTTTESTTVTESTSTQTISTTETDVFTPTTAIIATTKSTKTTTAPTTSQTFPDSTFPEPTPAPGPDSTTPTPEPPPTTSTTTEPTTTASTTTTKKPEEPPEPVIPTTSTEAPNPRRRKSCDETETEKDKKLCKMAETKVNPTNVGKVIANVKTAFQPEAASADGVTYVGELIRDIASVPLTPTQRVDVLQLVDSALGADADKFGSAAEGTTTHFVRAIEQIASKATEFSYFDGKELAVHKPKIQCGSGSDDWSGIMDTDEGFQSASGSDSRGKASIQLATSGLCGEDGKATVPYFVIYRNSKLFTSGTTTSDHTSMQPKRKKRSTDDSEPEESGRCGKDFQKTNGMILSSVLPDNQKAKIDARLRFRKEEFETPMHSNLVATWWDGSKWATNDQCRLVAEGDEWIAHCDHLTNFALLVQRSESDPLLCDNVLDKLGTGLSIASAVCLGILCFVYATRGIPRVRDNIYVQLLNNSKSSGSDYIVVCNVVATLLFYLAFILFSDQSFLKLNKSGCTVASAALYCLFLWSTILNLFQAWMLLLHCVSSQSELFLSKLLQWYVVFPVSFIVPVIVAVLIAILDSTFFYRDDQFCWISPDAVLTAVIIPVSVMLLNSALCFGFFTANIIPALSFRKQSFVRMSASSQNRSETLQKFLTLFFLQFTLGIPWILQYPASFSSDATVWHWLFAIFNGSYGVMMLLIYVYGRIVAAYKNCKATKEANSRQPTATAAVPPEPTEMRDSDEDSF